jgi:tRNA1(Val) A37 N6-methylase TrmN6
METSTTEDALLAGRVRFRQPRRGYRVAVDAVLLAAATSPSPGARVLDLGAGVGAMGLCLASRVRDCCVIGVELQPDLADLARRNAETNGMADRVQIVVHDIAQSLPEVLGKFQCVATNPPYLAAAAADPSPDLSKALATVESSAGLARWLRVATGALEPGGTLTMIHRSDRLDEITSHLGRLGWGDVAVKRLPPASRVLVRAREASQLQLRDCPPLTLHKPEGGYTDDAEAVLRHAAPIVF